MPYESRLTVSEHEQSKPRSRIRLQNSFFFFRAVKYCATWNHHKLNVFPADITAENLWSNERK